MQSHISLPTDQVDSVHVTTQWEIMKIALTLLAACSGGLVDSRSTSYHLILADIWFTPVVCCRAGVLYPLYCNTANITFVFVHAESTLTSTSFQDAGEKKHRGLTRGCNQDRPIFNQ